jgi:hypothetical protein
LTGLDKIAPNSKEYFALSHSEQMKYDEVNTKDFEDIIARLEVKGERQDKVIIRLATMRDIREKIMNRNN